MTPVESLLDMVPFRLSMPYTGLQAMRFPGKGTVAQETGGTLHPLPLRALRCDAAEVPCDACAICMQPVETSWSMQCMLCRRRIHSWCAPSPYDEAHPIVCRFCVQHFHGSGVSFRLHNVLMRPGFEISGCAEAAVDRFCRRCTHYCSAFITAGDVVERDAAPGKEEPVVVPGKGVEAMVCVQATRASQTPPLIVPDIHRVLEGTGLLECPDHKLDHGVAPGKHVIVASEEQIQRQFRGPSTPELLNADIAPLLSVCKKVGVEIKDFPTLNAPSKVVIEATMQRMRILDMLDDTGRLTPMGSSKLSFDFSPEWARTLAKAREYGVLEGGGQGGSSAFPRG